MHWFDRMAQQVAAIDEAPATRRGLLKGAAVAAVAAPLASDGLAYAGIRMEAYAAQSDCLRCLKTADQIFKDRMTDCALRAAYGEGRYAKKPKPKPKKPPKKVTPANGAKETECTAFARKKLINDSRHCRKGTACRPPPQPGPVPNPGGGGGGGGGGGSTCAPGTTKCGAELCCYGGDSCCPCRAAGGLICCAAVIGCTCC
jgi:hypothetical protein